MKLLLLLIPLLAVTWAQEAAAETESVTDLFQRVLDVENALKEEIAAEYQAEKQKREDAKNAISAKLNETIQAVDEAFQKKKAEYEAAKKEYEDKKAARDAEKKAELEEFVTEVKQVLDAVKLQQQAEEEAKKKQYEELLSELKTAYQKKQEAKQAEKEAKKQAFQQKLEEWKQKWNDFKTKVEQAKADKKEKRKQKFEELKAQLSELKILIENEAQARADKKAQLKQDSDAALEQYKTDIQSQKDALDAEAEELMQKYNTFSEKRDQLKETVKAAIREGNKAKMASYYGDKAQAALDKEAVKRVVADMLAKKTADDTAAAAPQAKATILDEITGASQWQTVTWLLLALSIFLSIALIAIIFYTLKNRTAYERLGGNDHGHDCDTERTPIARPVVPLGYTYEKAGGPSSVVVASPPLALTSSSAPIPLPPVGEELQY